MYFHGTTFDFDSFSTNNSYEMNFVGPGVYLSTCPMDSKEHYAGLGPDLIGRIDDELSFIFDEDEEDREGIVRDVVNRLYGGKSILLHCEFDGKFIVVDKSAPHWIEFFTYENEDEPELTFEGEVITSIFEERGYDFDILDGELRLDQIYEYCRDVADCGENIFQEIIIRLGYDAVLFKNISDWLYMYRNWAVDHLIVFNPDKVKIVQKEYLSSDEDIEEYIQSWLD